MILKEIHDIGIIIIIKVWEGQMTSAAKPLSTH